MRYNPMVKEKVCYLHGYRFESRYCVFKFVIAIREDENVFVVFRHFSKRSKHIHRNEAVEYGCWKELKFALPAICRIIPCVTLTLAVYAFSICSHMMPEELLSKPIVSATLARVSHNLWMAW